MAWNEPGKNRNPWGNRPERGAADLDEALRRLQRRLAGILAAAEAATATVAAARAAVAPVASGSAPSLLHCS